MKKPACLFTSSFSLPALVFSLLLLPSLFHQDALHAQVSAAFTVDVDSAAAPMTGQFFDQSTPQDSVILREWDLDGDGVTDSNEKNPYWTYEVPDTHLHSRPDRIFVSPSLANEYPDVRPEIIRSGMAPVFHDPSNGLASEAHGGPHASDHALVYADFPGL